MLALKKVIEESYGDLRDDANLKVNLEDVFAWYQ